MLRDKKKLFKTAALYELLQLTEASTFIFVSGCMCGHSLGHRHPATDDGVTIRLFCNELLSICHASYKLILVKQHSTTNY